MAEGDGGGKGLVRLDDFEGELEEYWQEAKGLKVFDKKGDEIGSVEDLYVYEEAEAVHLIKADIDGRRLLIPVDAVTTVGEEGVEVEQDRVKIVESPEHDSEDPPDLETSRATFEHYGYPDQLAL